MSQAFILYRLQQLDSQLDRIRMRLEEIRLALANDLTVRQAQEAAQKTGQALQAGKKELSHAEQAVKDQRIKIEQTEAALYGGKVRNPKELQDLQNETAALKRYLSVLEDRQIEAMINEEELSLQNQQAIDLTAQAQKTFDEHCQHLLEEQGRLEKDIPHLLEDRKAAASSITPEEQKLYDQLRTQRRGMAVTAVKDRACQACGTVLNAMLLDQLRTSPQISRCDHCGRILYLA
jgi:uncharacterized protein